MSLQGSEPLLFAPGPFKALAGKIAVDSLNTPETGYLAEDAL